MKDFIDRVAARALGGESMLLPRLPSLFEPQRALSTGLPEEVSEVVAPTAHRAMSIDHPAATSRTTPVSPVRTAVREAARAFPAVMPEQQPVVRHRGDNEPASVMPAVRDKVMASDESRLPSPRPVPASPERASQPLQVQRERLLEVLSVTEGRTAPEGGSLLAPAQSVFRTSPSTAGTTGTRLQPARAGQAMQSSVPHEPVVHVSIGRLEVRATPTPAKVAHRQDAPRPSPLDDYLRQRGKASP